MRKTRDYKAEYARRKASGAARGLSPSQTRGHAKAGEVSPKGASTPRLDVRLEAALRQLRAGSSLPAAARAIRISPERLRRYVKHHANATYARGVWSLDDQRLRDVLTFSRGEARRVRVIGFEEASRAGRYWQEAQVAIVDPDRFPEFEATWRGQHLIDAYGRRHALTTDPNQIYRLAHAYDDQRFEDIYNIVV